MDSDFRSFWLTAKGIGPRLSDGQGAERTMWATAINLMGWIDVEVGARTAAVHVNPTVVSEAVMARLPDALRLKADGCRITINLISPDIRLMSVCFVDAGTAVRYLEASVRDGRGSAGRPSIDDLLNGYG